MAAFLYHMKYGKQSGIRLCRRLFFSLLWVHGRMYWWKWRYQDLYGGTRPSGYLLSYETKKNSQTYSVFKSEKDMKRALYLWISNDKPPAGPFSINELNYTLGYKKNLLPKEFLNFPIREVPN